MSETLQQPEIVDDVSGFVLVNACLDFIDFVGLVVFGLFVIMENIIMIERRTSDKHRIIC